MRLVGLHGLPSPPQRHTLLNRPCIRRAGTGGPSLSSWQQVHGALGSERMALLIWAHTSAGGWEEGWVTAQISGSVLCRLALAGDPSCPAIEIHPHAVRAAQRRWWGSTRITPHLPSAESPNGSAPCAAPTAHRSRPAARVFRVHDCDSVVSMTCGRSTLVLSRFRTRTRDPATPSVASRDWSPDSTLSSREHNATLATPEQQQEEDHEPRAPKPSGLRARSWSLSRCAT